MDARQSSIFLFKTEKAIYEQIWFKKLKLSF